MSKAILISSARPGRIEYQVFACMDSELKRKGVDTLFLHSSPNQKVSLNNLISKVASIMSASCLVIQSPLALSLFPLVLFKALNKKVVAVVWDVYPWRLINKVRAHKSLAMRLIDIIEPIMFSLCTSIIIPTSDFFKSAYLSDAVVIPFWPPRQPLPSLLPPRSLARDSKTVVKVVFAGQVNATRDIVGAYKRLSSIACFAFEIIVFSMSRLPKYLEDRENVTNYGFVDRSTLNKIMSSCDLGLISLSPDFDAPAFPSKVFDYLDAGIPCLYYGPKMQAYKSLLCGCNICIDITASEYLDVQDIKQMALNFEANKQSFLDQVCLLPRSVDAMIELIHSE